MHNVHQQPESVMGRIIRVGLGMMLVAFGFIGTFMGSRAVVRSVGVRGWDARRCWVDDVRIIEHAPWTARFTFTGGMRYAMIYAMPMMDGASKTP